MSSVSNELNTLVPHLYKTIARDFQYPPNTNVSASNQCHVLTKGLHLTLRNQGIESRREFHRNHENIWHFIIAHTPQDAAPSNDDFITDLNPWQFMGRAPKHMSFLHASRSEVMERLEHFGAPDYYIALRGLDTIVHSHTDVIQPK
jgi:hypothetical protein